MTTPTFTKADADALVNHASTAPLANLQHAAKVDQLLVKFAQWFIHVTTPQDPTPKQDSTAGET